MPISLLSNLPQHPQPPPQEISVILDNRIYYLKLGHRRKDYKLSADDWFFDFLIERNPEWLVPLLQENKGAISLSFGSHQNCMECIVVLAEEASCYQKQQQGASRRKQKQRPQREVQVQAFPPIPGKQPSAAPASSPTSNTIYSTIQALPSFQLQVQVQFKKKKQTACSSAGTQTNTKLLLWKSLSDQIVGLGIHNNNTDTNDNAKQQEVSLEITLEKNNKHLGAKQLRMMDPSRIRTVLLQRKGKIGDPPLSLRLETMRVQPHPRRGASKPRQIVTVWNWKKKEATQNSITSTSPQQQVSTENDDETCTMERLGLQVQHVPTRVHSMASCEDVFALSNFETVSSPRVDDHTPLYCEYHHLNSNSVLQDDDDLDNDNERSMVEEYAHLNPLEYLEAAWEADEEFADQQREQEESSSSSVPQQPHGSTGPIVMDVVHTPSTKSTPSSTLEMQSSVTTLSNSDMMTISKPKRTKMPKQPSPSKKRRMAYSSEDLKRPAVPQHPKDLAESSSLPAKRIKMSKQPSAFKKQKIALSPSIIIDSKSNSSSSSKPPVGPQYAVDLTESPPLKKVPGPTHPLVAVAPLAGRKKKDTPKISQSVVTDKVVLIHTHNPLGSIGAVVKACSSNLYNVLTGKRTWGSKNSVARAVAAAAAAAAKTPVQDSKRPPPEKENQLLSYSSAEEDDDDEEEFEPLNVVSSSRWASVESMNDQEISKSPYEASVNAEVGEPLFDKVKALLEPNESGGWGRRKEASEEAIALFGYTLAKSLVLASSEIANSGMLYGSEWRDGTIRGVRVGSIPRSMLLLCLQEQRFARGNNAVLANVIQDLGIDDMVKEGMEEWGIESDYDRLALTKHSFVFTSMKVQCQRCEVFVARAFTFMKTLKLKSIDDTLMAKVRACLKIMEANVRVPKGKERRRRKKKARVAEAARPVKIPISTSDTIDGDGTPCIGVSRRVSDSTVGRDSEDASQSSVEWISEVSVSPKKKQIPTTKTTNSSAVPKDKLDQSSDARQQLSAATTGMIGDLVKLHGKDRALELVKHMSGGTLVSSPSKSGHAEKTNKTSTPSPHLPLNSAGLTHDKMGSTNVDGSSTRKSKLPQDHNDLPKPGTERPRKMRMGNLFGYQGSKKLPLGVAVGAQASLSVDDAAGSSPAKPNSVKLRVCNTPPPTEEKGVLPRGAKYIDDARRNESPESCSVPTQDAKNLQGAPRLPQDRNNDLNEQNHHLDRPIEMISYQTGKVVKQFGSVVAAASALETRAQFIQRILAGTRKSHLGYFFRYQGTETALPKITPGRLSNVVDENRAKKIYGISNTTFDSEAGDSPTNTRSVDLPSRRSSGRVDDGNTKLDESPTSTPFDCEAVDSPGNMSSVDLRRSRSSGRVDDGNTKLDERPMISLKPVEDPRDPPDEVTHNASLVDLRSGRSSDPVDNGDTKLDERPVISSKAVYDPRDLPHEVTQNMSSVDLRSSRSSGRIDDGNTNLDERPMISSKPVDDPRDLPEEVTHAHSSSRWACVAAMDIVSVSPYEASTNAEVGEPIFDKVKTLLVANEGGGSKRHKEASDDAIKLFGPTLAKSLVLANHQIALSGILYGSEWKDGMIRGFRYGFIPKSMLLLCLQEQRFGRGDNEAVLVKVIQDLGVDGTVKEAIEEWGIGSDYNNLATAPGAFVFTSLKAQCHRCEVFVARAYTFLKVLKAKSIDDSLMAKVKSCLKIMEANVRASPPLRKRKKSTPSAEFARRVKIRTNQSQTPAIGPLTKVGRVAVKNSKIGSDGVVLEAFEPPLALSSSSHMLEVTSATIEGYLWTVSNKAEMTKVPTRKVEKTCLKTTQPPGCATRPKASKCIDAPRHKRKQKQTSPRVNPVPPIQLDDGVIDLTDDVDDEPQASDAEQLQSFGGLRHVLFSKFGATYIADGAKEGLLSENKSSPPATGAESGTSSTAIRHDVVVKASPVAVANGAAGYLSDSGTESKATIPETKPASLLKSLKTPLLFPASSGTDAATPWCPHDYDEIILNATEIEVAWLVEESIYGLRNREIQWDFVWEYASPGLRIQLRKVDFACGTELEQLIRFQDVLVSKRFPVKRRLIRRELHRGELRERMRDVVPKLRLAGRQLIGLVKAEQE
jgi:hypothetical protein